MLISNDAHRNTNDSDDYIIETRTPPPKDRRYYRRTVIRMIWEIVSWGAIGLILTFTYFTGTVNQVAGNSMDNTINDGMYVIGVTSFSKPSHGDIVTANPSQSKDLHIIKRVIAVEGDELRFDGSQIYLNGELLDEPYIREPMHPIPEVSYVIPEDHIWIMGDNRNNSNDSRHFGAVSLDDVTGKSLFYYHPFNLPFSR